MEYKAPNAVGLGSFFHYYDPDSLKSFDIDSYLKNYELFYTGRHAIKILLQSLEEQKKINTIWLPHYYCQHVTRWLMANFPNIDFYTIDPFDPDAPIDITSFAHQNDVVILNNFWGIYDYEIPEREDRAIYIEDHSHGWLSASCLKSEADFCFASLRKTLPVPLGGIIWRGSGRKIVLTKDLYHKDESFSDTWETIEKAMKRKHDFIGNQTGRSKDIFLKPIQTAEHFLHNQHQVIEMKEKHILVIQNFLKKDYSSYKEINLGALIHKLIPTNLFKVLQNDKKITFGLNLLIKTEKIYENLTSFLIQNNIYPSQLWPDNKLDLEWKYLINIHVDFRYTPDTMDYVANKLNNWIKKQHCDNVSNRI